MQNILDKFRKEPLRDEVLPFLSSIREDMWLVKEDLLGSIAHVIMLYEQNIITKNDAALILNELLDILESVKKGTFIPDEKFEDIHPNIEAIIIERIGIDVGGKLHSARSRNDQVALDIRLKIRGEIIDLFHLISDLIEVLLNRARETADYVCPLYTHLQRGQLGVFSHYLLYYSHQLIRIAEDLVYYIRKINKSPLGAGAIGGTMLNINRNRVAELLGMDGLVINSIDAISSRDYIINILSLLVVLADIYTRISEDFIIWSTTEFGFIEIDDGYASVSSAMPQKKNPDSLELIKGKMSRVYAGLNHILFMSKGCPSGYVRDFQESKVPLAYALDTIKMATKILTGVMATFIPNKERMRKAVNESLVMAIDLAELLVRNFDMSFREAHHLVGALVKKYGGPDVFNPFNISAMAEKLFGKKLSPEKIKDVIITDPLKLISLRKSIGAPSPDNTVREIEEISSRFSRIKGEMDKISINIDNAIRSMLSLAKSIGGAIDRSA